jgi:predicted Zn-dependent protease
MRHPLRITLSTLLLCAGLLTSSGVITGCTYNPATGRNQLLWLSTEQQIALGTEAKPELVQEYGGEAVSPELRAYVTEVGMKLVAHVEPEYADLPWEFTVLESDVINAFALPGGKVFMSRGLMDLLKTEAELAGVLGHEVGHVTAQHINERISQSMVVQGIAIGASVGASNSDGWEQVIPVVVGVGGQGYLLSFGRSQESESDRQGVKYMTRAGYNPVGMMGVLQVLKAASEGNSTPEFLSTHPHPETRIDTVQKLLAGEYAYTQNNPDFMIGAEEYQRRAGPYLKKPQ